MNLLFKCRCGTVCQVGIELVGKIVRCQECGCNLPSPSLPTSRPRPESDLYGPDDGPAHQPMLSRSRKPSWDILDGQ